VREDLLHFIWKYKRLSLVNLATTGDDTIVILDTGSHNHLAGPDFFNARIRIGKQLWAGNVEIHVKSSDWYVHRHEEDTNYDNVILHVVWEDDASVFRKDGSEIPTLELKAYVSKEVLLSYQNLFNKKRKTFVNCEKDIAKIDTFLLENWLERLYVERLERKSGFIESLLKRYENDWERVLFILLLKNFGLKINGASFLSLGNTLDFSIVRKLRSDASQLEAVLYGMAQLLEDETIVDAYYLNLKKDYNYLKSKFDLNNDGVLKPAFFKLRPPNFPTIRFSQLANLYNGRQNVFDTIINANTLQELYLLFDVSASPYWNDHFTFGKVSKKSTKKLTKKFIDLLIVNTILPLKFCHSKQIGSDINEDILKISAAIGAEDNSIISNFKDCKIIPESVHKSQALLELYNEYCTENKCLQCAVGSSLLQGND